MDLTFFPRLSISSGWMWKQLQGFPSPLELQGQQPSGLWCPCRIQVGAMEGMLMKETISSGGEATLQTPLWFHPSSSYLFYWGRLRCSVSPRRRVVQISIQQSKSAHSSSCHPMAFTCTMASHLSHSSWTRTRHRYLCPMSTAVLCMFPVYSINALGVSTVPGVNSSRKCCCLRGWQKTGIICLVPPPWPCLCPSATARQALHVSKHRLTHVALTGWGGYEQHAAFRMSQLKRKAKSISVYRAGEERAVSCLRKQYRSSQVVWSHQETWVPPRDHSPNPQVWIWETLTCTRTRHKFILHWKYVLGESWCISLCSWTSLKIYFCWWGLIGWMGGFFPSRQRTWVRSLLWLVRSGLVPLGCTIHPRPLGRMVWAFTSHLQLFPCTHTAGSKQMALVLSFRCSIVWFPAHGRNTQPLPLVLVDWLMK